MGATMSTGPPGAVGRIRRMGLPGKPCAWLASVYVRPQASAATARATARSNAGGFIAGRAARALAQQLAVRPDHRQVDRAPAAPRFARVIHVHAPRSNSPIE